MKQRHEIRSYDYVNHPYAAVRQALVTDPAAIFAAATRAYAVSPVFTASAHVDPSASGAPFVLRGDRVLRGLPPL